MASERNTKADKTDLSFEIVSDSFPNLKESLKEYDRHCVAYILHNKDKAYVGETSNLRSRFKDHQESKKKYGFNETKIILSGFFNKSAVYDIESRLINYMYADSKFEVVNIKTNQSPHFYYQKEKYNTELFQKIWNDLRGHGIANRSIEELENSPLFKYSPFKEFSDEQIRVSKSVVEIVTRETLEKDIAFDGTESLKREFIEGRTRTIIRGGPGTGKTLLVVKLVHDLIRRHGVDQKKIAICIPQSNLLKTFREMLKSAKLRVSVIKPVDLSRVKENEYDLLIVDETHRLKKFFNKQAKDLKHLEGGKHTELDLADRASRHLVLMYDERQRVRPADINPEDVSTIKKANAFVLSQQFRVKKGVDYLKFISGILQIGEDKPRSTDLGEYEFRIIDSIQDLQAQVKAKNDEVGLSRLSSGYYVEWISKSDPKKFDFAEEGLKAKWNTSIVKWVHSKSAIDEVGCIHTLQGEDLNYAGVIIGDDLYLDPKDQKIKVRRDRYFDRNGTPILGTDSDDQLLTAHIKNIYYVLLTRGMLGTFVYVKDPALKHYLASTLKAV